ncbi:MAG TPA: hypothetical protein DIU15_06960 [Deltaproteobacteria bacterium]|nr:hypothetical protein [Deltaproteobacteria bacterium]HCP45762.1 hypothetical protein [Deltaproteobacteria bacterium]
MKPTMTGWFVYLLILASWGLAALLAHGAENSIPTGMAGDGWSAARYASLSWSAVGVVLACAYLARRRETDSAGVLALVAASGLFVAVAALYTLGIAVERERQNYWDAYHFTALIWTYFLASCASLWSSLTSAKGGSTLGSLLIGPATLSVALAVLWWLWTWLPWMQNLQGWFARLGFLLTHG